MTGALKHGLPHGNGVLAMANGTTVTGRFADGAYAAGGKLTVVLPSEALPIVGLHSAHAALLLCEKCECASARPRRRPSVLNAAAAAAQIRLATSPAGRRAECH